LYSEAIMANNVPADFVIEEIEIEDNDVGPDDFTFVIGPDGDLKTMIIPQHLMEDPPEEIQLILKLFGIDDINTIEDRTLH
jgi:hypothetical protein